MDLAATPAPANVTAVSKVETTRVVYMEVVIALAAALGLVVVLLVQLVYRSASRHTTLMAMRKRLRFDMTHFANKPPGDARRAIIESSRQYFQHKITKPPQYHTRVIPVVNRDRRDVRSECLQMHQQLRSALLPAFPGVRTMSMRAMVTYCLEDELEDRPAMERFLQIFESVLYGVHVADGSDGDVSVADVKFMHAYFNTSIKKCLPT